MSRVLLGIDLGTSAVKASLYGMDGCEFAASGVPYPTLRTGQSEEQEPRDWLKAVSRTLSEVLAHGRPVALAVTGQMSGLLLADAEGQPVFPFLPWSDRRAEAEASGLAERFGAGQLYQATGCRAVGSYPAAKLKWVQEHHPDRWAQVRRVLGAREYLLRLLTGVYVSDPSCAGATQLFDLRNQVWWVPMLDALGLDISCLPNVMLPWEQAGVTGPWAASLGLPAGIPVAAGAGDGVCSSLGAGAREVGDVVISVGTSGVVRSLAAQPLIHPTAATTCYPLGPGLYAGTGVTSTAGAALEWTASLLGLPDTADLERVALGAPAGAAGLTFVPYLGGSRTPFWDAGARGSFVGLDLSHTRAHMARAAIEGVALSLVHALDALRNAGAPVARILLTGGGSRSQLLTATLAGLTNLPTFVTRGGDATLGAAQLAGVAGGFFPDLGAARQAMAPALHPVEPETLPPGMLARYCTLAEPISSTR